MRDFYAGGQHHAGIKHGRGCACKACDPDQTRFAAAKAAALAAKGLPVTPALEKPRAPSPIDRLATARRRAERDPRTRRLAELLRAGTPRAEAFEIIDREFSTTGEP